ncbi:MAG TPA: hypothetical protein VGQ36_17115 [Thermoanaerobaculia bacterium]|jgi:hypothetical protein|nr:hypothetical protein [Thermoanaerobaculia bacterium]
MLRKHRTALIALAVYNFVFFFPVAFMARVVSPNDVFTNFSPWNMGRPLDVVRAQNSLLNDPPTAYFTLLALAKQDPRTFHWNPYIASGVPGFGSAAAATLTPFALIPLLLPLKWLYTAMAFLKLNASFVFTYLWLREERLGRRGAAIGAILFAGAGMYSVRWLWHITNTTALYPALLWIVRRTFNGRRTPLIVITLIALSYAISGFPATIAYGAWVTVFYMIFGVRRQRLRFLTRAFVPAALGVLIAGLIALPTLIPFFQLIRRSGYLEIRQTMSINAVYPLHHALNFVLPDRLGNPAYKNWTGDPRLGVLDNYVESTIYLGLLAIPLALLGLFNRRARARWFWLVAALLIVACMFAAPVISTWIARVPGFKYSALARLGLILPLPIAYLAAAARLRKQLVYDAVAILIAFDLALFAGRFHPYLTHEQADVPTTPTIAFLQSDQPPFRVAPMMDYLWPNSSELVRVEDVRSHFSSEADYRKMLQRLEPGAWSGRSTVITFFSPNFNFDDPLTGLLGIRWYVEHKYIDILKWGIFKATVPGVKETGTIALKPGMTLQREVCVDAEPFWSIELPVNIESGNGRIEVTLLKNGAPVWSRAFTKDEANVMNKIYVPLRPYARLGETVTLRVRANGVKGYVLEAENKQSVFYGRVTTPIYFDRELPEGRIFRNLAELPRFRAVSRLRKLNDDEFLAARDIDFEREAVITDDPVQPPALTPSNARVTLTHYAPNEQRIATTSDAPFYLASSEKLTPELAITIDGRRARAIETDMIFAGVPVPAGRHEIVFSRRIGRGWWWAAGVGAVLLAVGSVVEWRRR